MDAQLVAMQVFTGLALGATYVLMGIGLSLIFGLLTVVNFAHGSFFMVGAYLGVYLFGVTGNFWLALVATPLGVGLLGMAVERVLVRPLYGRGIDYPLLLTFGLSYVMISLVRIGFGREGLPFDTPEALQGATSIGVGMFPTYRLFLIGLTAVVVCALWLFLEKTRYGLVIRASARDPVIVRVLGVDVSKVRLVAFGIGTAYAGLAGILAAPIRGVTPEMGDGILVDAFVITVVGGMGSIPGAVVAGLAIGIVVSLTSLVAPEMAQLSMYVMMALVLLSKPTGLLGTAA
jgi:branched-chain amino acid transport system permease protein